MEPIKVISWGCGVQSTTMAVMSALGDLEKVDMVVTADLHWEHAGTYKAMDFYTNWLREHGLRVDILDCANIRNHATNKHMHMPFFTKSGAPLRRECTGIFKIEPIRRHVKSIYKLPHVPSPKNVEMWLGISLDEYTRMRTSEVKFVVNRYPLVEKYITRDDCIEYLVRHSLPVPPKSSCIGCPYKLPSEWLRLKKGSPNEFEEAVKFDDKIRNLVPGGLGQEEIFVYKYSVPLRDADFEKDTEREKRKIGKQLPLICESGFCFV